jgi:hypothetical protein
MASHWARRERFQPGDTARRQAGEGIDWRQSMSDHVAYALLVYTGLQIFMTVHAMKDGGNSIMPYLALVALVALIIPFCRHFERRWRDLPDSSASDPALAGTYRRDLAMLWLLAIGMPAALTLLIKAATAIF